MGLRTLNTRTLRMNLIYNFACMFLLMYSLLYDFFCNFPFPPFPLITADPLSDPVGTPVKFDDRDLTQKLCNKLCKVPNNNKNVLKDVRMAHQLYTMCTARSTMGDLLSDQLLYSRIPLNLFMGATLRFYRSHSK